MAGKWLGTIGVHLENSRLSKDLLESIAKQSWGNLMRFWRIVAGHRERDPDEVKSVVLGDWLRHNYISIGWTEPDPQFRVFRNMRVNDKVIAYTDGHVWAIGTITGEVTTKRLREDSLLYEHARAVKWDKITKISYRKFPKPLKNKLRARRAVNELPPHEWGTFVSYLMRHSK